MKRKLYLLGILVLLFIVPTNAQLLWKISGNDLEKPSYLFGTHHLIEKEKIKDFDKALEYCRAAEVTIGELDLSDMQNMTMAIMQAGVMTDSTYQDLMSEEDYALVDNEFKSLMGVGLDQLGKLKPMMLSTMYTVLNYMKIHGLTAEPQSVDEIFQKEAGANNKQVLGLETADEQINLLFNTLPLKSQAELLVQSIKDKEIELEMTNQLNEAYIAGDGAKIIEMIEKYNTCTMSQEYMEKLIDNRNNNWVAQLPQLLKENSCFIAVGYAHLVGETGLINQFEKLGYKVEPVVE